MKHLTIGIFHDENLGRELGRKGTESDILMFNRKTDESIFTFMHPVEEWGAVCVVFLLFLSQYLYTYKLT